MSVEASEATVEDSRLLCVAGCGGVNAGSHPTRFDDRREAKASVE